LAASSPRLLENHLLAVKFLYGSYVLSVQVVLILIHAGSIDDVIGLVLGTLRGWSRRQFQTAISADHDVLLSTVWFGTYDGGLLVGSRGRSSLGDLSRVYSMIIVMMVRSRVRVLVEVHQNVLNLSLL
jgi:hypothetical protein